MAVSQTNIKDFMTIFVIGGVIGAAGLFLFNNVKRADTTFGTITKPEGLSPTTDAKIMDNAAKYGIYDDDMYMSNASYFWDFRNPYLAPSDNVLYNKAPFIELQSTSEFDPNNPKFGGSYTTCGMCTQ